MNNQVKVNPASGRSIALWAGVLGGPILWAIQLNVCYALSPAACGKRGTTPLLHAVTVACLLLAIVGGYLSYRDWRDAGAGSPDETDGGPVARTRFLGALGIISCLMFGITIVAQGLAGFFLDGCWL